MSLFSVGGNAGSALGPALTTPLVLAFGLSGTLALLLPLLLVLPLVGPVAAVVLLGAIGFVAIATFSVTVVMGQACLPSRPGLASGVTLGLAIGLLPVPSLLLALSLPRSRAPATPPPTAAA